MWCYLRNCPLFYLVGEKKELLLYSLWNISAYRVWCFEHLFCQKLSVIKLVIVTSTSMLAFAVVHWRVVFFDVVIFIWIYLVPAEGARLFFIWWIVWVTRVSYWSVCFCDFIVNYNFSQWLTFLFVWRGVSAEWGPVLIYCGGDSAGWPVRWRGAG